jgi:hypothetical protein
MFQEYVMDNDTEENLKRSEVSVLEKQANATRKVNTSLENLNYRIESLEKSFVESSNSSSKMAFALNYLTGALVFVGLAQIAVAICAK